MPQADLLRSPITTTAKKKHLAEIVQLIADAVQIENLRGRMGPDEGVDKYALSEGGVLICEKVQDGGFSYAPVERDSIEKVQQFRLKARHLLRIFGRELPDAALASADAQMVQLFTENEAEGEHLAGRFWITDVFDSEPTDAVERRCGIDLQAIRDTRDWLRALAARLEADGGQRDGHPGAPKSNELARTKDRVRALRKDGLPFVKICEFLDKESIATPGNARWRHLKWPVAYKRHTKTVKSWMSKACKGIMVTRLLR